MNNLIAILVPILLSSCLSRNQKKAALETPPKPDTTQVFFRPASGFKLDDSSGKIDASTLSVYQFAVGKSKIGGNWVPIVTFNTDPTADSVNWQACSTTKADNCHQGVSVSSGLILATLEPGTYSIEARACVTAERARNTSVLCGQASVATWTQPEKEVDEKLTTQLYDLEGELASYGSVLVNLFQEFVQGFSDCGIARGLAKGPPEGGNPSSQRAWEIYTLVANWIQLGPTTLSYCLQGVATNAEEDKLTGVLSSLLIASSDPRGALDPKENPFGKVDQKALDEYFFSRMVKYTGSSTLLNPSLVSRKILMGSGFASAASDLSAGRRDWRPLKQSDWNQLSPSAKSSLMAGLLALMSGQEIPTPKAINYSCFESVTSVFRIEPKLSNDPCTPLSKLTASLETVRSRITYLKGEIAKVQGVLNR